MSSNFAQQNAKSKHMLKMLNLPLKELKLDAKNGGIKGYRSMSKDKLLSMVNTPKQIKEHKTIRDIRKENSNTD